MDYKENMIEFTTPNRGYATVTFNDKKFANRIRKAHAAKADEMMAFYDNDDGSVCATIPLSWIKINYNKRQLSEEQKAAAAERLREVRANGKS